MRNIIASLIMIFTGVFASSVYAADTAQIDWTAPTTYEDGGVLDPTSEILQYTIYYGTASGSYSQQVVVSADARSYTFTGLSGTYYFVATATSSELEESAYSNELTRKFSKGKPSTFTISFGD